MKERKWIKKNLDLESFYNDVQNIFEKRGSLQEKVGRGAILDLVFMNLLSSTAQDKVDEYIGVETENRCSVQCPTVYGSGHFEPILWMLGLISLSWLTINLKKKTEDGHCQNPDHKLFQGHPYCNIGSEFHRGFYDALLETLNVLTTYVHEQTPNVIETDV
jgi:hypothetical protein